mmetsp:Transcript_30796/g.88458  ORF Transcript_30796/g.88458 Transcript_30796/m.88458 type:complete len:347 (+) Transcript_30796:367-1407(+)
MAGEAHESLVAVARGPPKEEPDEQPLDEVGEARLRWEEHWKETFPGRQWGWEPRCAEAQMSISPEVLRSLWVEKKIAVIFGTGASAPSLRGLEIGACQLPVTFPPNVQMRYLDMFDNTATLRSQCFLKDGARLPDIVDDAQLLKKIQNATFDIVLAAHVLEHMPNVLGAIFNWLRILRTGGLAFVVLPDLCDLKHPFGERFRMVARPSHFVDEFRRAGAADEHFMDHCREMGVAVSTIDLLRAWSGMGPFVDIFGQNKLPELVDTKEVKVPLSMDPAQVNLHSDTFAKRPHNVHLHLWTVKSVRSMLQAALPLFAEQGVHFRIADVHSAGRTWLNMQELRVTLQRT